MGSERPISRNGAPLGKWNAGDTGGCIACSLPDGNGGVSVVLTVTQGPASKIFDRLSARTTP
jgi:hypothetical protein